MRVLLATDGSPDAQNATEWVRHLPLPVDAQYRVISVMSPSAHLTDLDAAAWQTVRAAAKDLLDETRRRLGDAVVETAVVDGDPREAIAAEAADWRADLVVLGARGLGAVKEFLLGSVSLAVTRHAPCSVLVCKGTPRDVRTITIAYDGSAGADAAVGFVTTLRLPHHAHVRVLGVAEAADYVVSGSGMVAATVGAATAAVEAERSSVVDTKLKPIVAKLWPRVATVDSTVTVGRPASEIVRYAGTTDTDLLVVGARGMGRLSRLLLGSVSESVVRHASCPVLCVRAPVVSSPEPTYYLGGAQR